MFGYDIFLSEHPEYQVFRRRRNEARAAAFYAAAKPLRSALATGVRLSGRAFQGLARWRVQRQVVRELSALDDRVLRDIGIERGDIRAIARGFVLNSETAVTAAELAPAESAPLAKPRPAAPQVRPRLAAIAGGRRDTQRPPRPAAPPAVPAGQRQALAGCG